MADYSLVVNSKFQPFSFERYIQPYQMYGEAYKEVENAYEELSQKASVWEEMANKETDPYAYKMYKTYANDLESKADQLAREGLNAASRKNMLNMRTRYGKEITPIEAAYKRREELVAEQRKASLSNPTMFYQRKASAMSLDDFIKNPSIDYGEKYSGALLRQQTGQMAANLKTALTGKGKLKGVGLPYQYEQLLQYGYTPQQIQQAITNPREGDLVLNTIVDLALQASGMNNWASDAQLAQAKGYAYQGLFDAIGKTEFKNFTDSYNMQSSLARNTGDTEDSPNKFKMYNINPTSLFGDSEVASMNQKTLQILNKWKNKGYFNSQGNLTKKGLKALQDATYETKDKKGPTGYMETKVPVGDWEFKNWALKHGHSQAGINAGKGSPTLNRYYQSTLKSINEGKLITGTPNIDVYRQAIKDDTTREYVRDKITAALAGGDIYPVSGLHVDKNGTVTMTKGEGVSSSKFKKAAKDNPILHIINSPTTNNQLVELSDGTMYIMPGNVLDNINRGNLSDTNQKLTHAGSSEESAILLNQANSYLGSILNYNEGTGASTNDGTIIF